jgi:hypothetical protein
MILKCNHCKQNITLFGDWKAGQLTECVTCHKGIGVVPGERRRPRWWQKAYATVPYWSPDSRIPLLNGTPYRLGEAIHEMERRPGTLWAPIGRIKYGMCCAYSYNGREFIAVGHDSKPGNDSGPEAKLPFEAPVQDWYELDLKKFYTIFFHWEDRWEKASLPIITPAGTG